jgi:hypothetical protein
MEKGDGKNLVKEPDLSYGNYIYGLRNIGWWTPKDRLYRSIP